MTVRRRVLSTAALVACLAVSGTVTGTAQTTNPRFGHWKLKPAATAAASTAPASTNIMTYEAYNGTGMRVTVETTNAAGNKSSWGYTTMFDGQPMPVTGRAGTDAAIVRIISDKVNEIIYKQGDRVTQFLVNVLSGDGQTIQVSYYTTNAQGDTRETQATYEKQPQ
jgi:hypothetical protein